MKKVLLSLIVLLLIFSSNDVLAEGEEIWGYTKYSMNVRNSADSKIIGSSGKYSKISGIKHPNGWIETSYGNWIQLADGRGYVYDFGFGDILYKSNLNDLVIRSNPSSSSKRLGIKPAFSNQIKVIKSNKNGNWLKLYDEPGYIYI